MPALARPPTYDRTWLRPDVVAGLTLRGLLASVHDSLDITSAEILTKLVAKVQQTGIEVAAVQGLTHSPDTPSSPAVPATAAPR